MRGSQAGAYLFACAALAVALVMAFFLVTAEPRAETVVRYRPTPSHPTLAQFRRILEPIATIQDNYVTSPDGRPFHCAIADSTFDPEATQGIVWQAQYCWQVTRAEVDAAG